MQILELQQFLQHNDIQGIVFDLDGTLIDSAPDILGAMREAFSTMGLGEVPEDYFPDNLHGTSEGIMRHIISDMGWTAPSDFSGLLSVYFEIYARRNHSATRLYPGVRQFLMACNELIPMAICTNKIERNAKAALRVTEIDNYFRVVSGADTWSATKPSPVPLLETIRSLDLMPQQCLYFGDTSVDAECANRAGVRFVLHSGGYGDQALGNQPCFKVFNDWNEWLLTSSPA